MTLTNYLHNSKSRKITLSDLSLFLFLFLHFFLIFYRDFRYNSPIFSRFVLLSTIIVLVVFSRIKFKNDEFIVWLVIFFTYILLSCFWAYDLYTSYVSTYRLLPSVIIIFLLYYYIDSKEKIVSVLKVFVLAAFFAAILLIVQTRLDLSILKSIGNWNTNDIGIFAYRGAFISFVIFLYSYNSNKKNKNFLVPFFYLIIALTLIILSFATNSRRTLIGAILAFLFFFFIISKKSLFIKLLITAISLSVLSILIFKVPFFYDKIGYRIESMFMGISDIGTDEASFNTHRSFYYRGYLFFLERPILGYGVGNYEVLNEQFYSWRTYSHNNFTELIVGLGIIGFLIFYFPYIYIFFNIKKNKNCLIFSGLVSIIVSDIAVQFSNVSYNDEIIILFFAFVFWFIKSNKKELVL